MGDGDERLRPLPRAPPGEVDRAEFGDDEIGLTARIGDDLAVELRENARVPLPCFVDKRACHADKGLAAAAHGGAGEKIELAARAADLAQTGRFRRDLTL